jgi:DNA-binding SARP family transcriptional activator
MALQLHLFGSPQCRREGRPIIIRRRKAIALLAYLAVTAQTHSRDTLATLFWPEYDQSGSRANLRRDLSYLKRALGDDVLAIDWVEVGLNPQVTLHLDVTDFITRLAQAKQHDDPLPQLCPDCLITLTETVDLYTGDFMVGFSLPDCPEFDEWQFFQRESLRQTLAAALQRLIGWHVVQGTYEQAIEYGRRWLALDPCMNRPIGSSCSYTPGMGSRPRPCANSTNVSACWMKNWALRRRQRRLCCTRPLRPGNSRHRQP